MAAGEGIVYFTDNPNLGSINPEESENRESHGFATPGGKTAKCVVPNVAGMTVGHARLLLKKAGCALGRVKHRKARKRLRGRVLAQSMRAHRTLKHGARVDLTVGR
jgi:beta-lactam-binding protein with PASTA domain